MRPLPPSLALFLSFFLFLYFFKVYTDTHIHIYICIYMYIYIFSFPPLSTDICTYICMCALYWVKPKTTFSRHSNFGEEYQECVTWTGQKLEFTQGAAQFAFPPRPKADPLSLDDDSRLARSDLKAWFQQEWLGIIDHSYHFSTGLEVLPLTGRTLPESMSTFSQTPPCRSL